jgi:hypothetical protein
MSVYGIRQIEDDDAANEALVRRLTSYMVTS